MFERILARFRRQPKPQTPTHYIPIGGRYVKAVEGGDVTIREGLTDRYGRLTTQISITPADDVPGEKVWRVPVPRRDDGGRYIVNISQLKTVKGKDEEEGK